MTVEINWVVEQLDCKPEAEGQLNLVACVHWRVNGTDGTYAVTNYGTVSIDYVPDSVYIPYSELTLSQIISWVKNSLGAETVAAIETGIENRLAELANPPIISPALPWKN